MLRKDALGIQMEERSNSAELLRSPRWKAIDEPQSAPVHNARCSLPRAKIRRHSIVARKRAFPDSDAIALEAFHLWQSSRGTRALFSTLIMQDDILPVAVDLDALIVHPE